MAVRIIGSQIDVVMMNKDMMTTRPKTDPLTGCGHFDTATKTCTTAPAP